MKTTILAALALSLSLPALAAVVYEGDFSMPHSVAFLSYANKQACEEDKGQWDGDAESGICLFDAEDTVSVKKSGAEFTVAVSTVTTNAHMCDFEGKGRVTGDANVIEASAPSEEYVEGQNGGEGKLVPATCRLQVSYAGDAVSVKLLSRYAECSEFCGANASLEIESAKRK